MAIQSVNPVNGETIREYEEMTPEEVRRTIEKTEAAFSEWKGTSFSHRAALMKKAGQVLRGKAEEYARLMALEMGKPLAGGRAEVEKCAFVCDYYAENAERFLADEAIETDAAKSFVHLQLRIFGLSLLYLL